MYSGRPLQSSNHAGLVGLIAIVASFVAHAQVSTASSAVPPKAKPGYRGSALTYGHQATAYTFDRAAEPQYNPTWSHRLGIIPEWHFNDQLFVRGRLFLGQEFTASDSTNHRNEVELSDLALEVGVSGFTEPFTRIRIGGDVRVTLPTSKLSHGATRLLAIGPGLALSRTFGFGLTVAYTGRYSYRFHRYTTGLNDAPSIAACGNPLAAACAEFLTTGRRNAHSDLTHGAAIGFAPIEKLSINAAFHLSHLWLYPLAAVPAELGPITEARDTPMRSFTNFELAVSWQLFKPIGITVGASTFSPQLNTYGTRYFPLFNRNTTLYLDLSFDVEAAVSGLLGEST
ncbi:MAG: hypothetical protein H6Q89_638 [Myxococcaceae bacterium]|nr:hypothetical protein [Myxococcaceae bacterium]